MNLYPTEAMKLFCHAPSAGALRKCSADQCMAWCWDSPESRETVEANGDQPPDTRQGWELIAANGRVPRHWSRKKERKGFCGLVGNATGR